MNLVSVHSCAAFKWLSHTVNLCILYERTVECPVVSVWTLKFVQIATCRTGKDYFLPRVTSVRLLLSRSG